MGKFATIGLIAGVVGFQFFGTGFFESTSGLNWSRLLAAGVVGGVFAGIGGLADARSK